MKPLRVLLADDHSLVRTGFRSLLETHRAQLMDRLNIHDVPGLVRYALRKGLTTLQIGLVMLSALAGGPPVI